MHISRGFSWLLLAGLLGSGSTCLAAQAPANGADSGTYYIKLTAAPRSTAEQPGVRKHNALRSSAYWDDLYNVGKVRIVGATKDGSSAFGLVILEGVSETEAVSIANADPSVKAGITTAEVLPMQVFQAKNQPRPKTR